MTDDAGRPVSLFTPPEVTALLRYVGQGSQRLRGPIHIEGGAASVEDLFAAIKAGAIALAGVILCEGFNPEVARPARSARCLPADLEVVMDEEVLSLSGLDRRMAPPVPFTVDINTEDVWHFRLYNTTDGFFELRLTGTNATFVLYILPYQNERAPYLPRSRG